MKVGDLVRCKETWQRTRRREVGVVVDNIEKKVWRTDELGPHVDWDRVDPEPHAVVLFAHNDGTINIPWVELEVVTESTPT